VRGQLRISGSRPRSLLASRGLASAFFCDPLVTSRTLEQHLVASAELAGVPAEERAALVGDALARTKLESFRRTKLDKASGLVRRGAHLAAALATGAGTLVLSDPAEDLEQEAALAFVAAVMAAIDDKAYLVFRGRAAGGPRTEDRALVFQGGSLVAEGAPSELAAQKRTYAVRLAGDPAAFLAALAARSFAHEPLGPGYVRLTFPEGEGTHAAFALAEETGVIITELAPIALGFS
jgi:energy-coupling factor transporter ATP-binding protein EcfA2